MADEQQDTDSGARTASSDTMRRIGLAVFLAGVAMIIMVFVWAYGLFGSIDTEIAEVFTTPAVTNPAAASTTEASEASPPAVAVAAPSSGPSLTQTAAALGLKLIFLALMAWAGALVAGKGVAMTRRRP